MEPRTKTNGKRGTGWDILNGHSNRDANAARVTPQAKYDVGRLETLNDSTPR